MCVCARACVRTYLLAFRKWMKLCGSPNLLLIHRAALLMVLMPAGPCAGCTCGSTVLSQLCPLAVLF